MPLSADNLLDRIKLKGQIRRWRSLAILTLVALAFLLIGKPFSSNIAVFDRDFIARIAIKDIIFEDTERDKILEEIKKNTNIKAVVVRINSPGGTVVGGETLYNSLRQIAEKKPVVAVMESVAASGAYMAALGADLLVAHHGTITGSIGVILQTAEVTDLAQKWGIHFITFKSGPLKAVPSPFEKITPAASQAIQSSVEDTHRFFVDIVANRRNMPLPVAEKLADGRIYTGRQALENKLVDALGDEKTALKWIYEQKHISSSLPIRDIDLVVEKKWWKTWLSSFSFMGHKIFMPQQFPGGLLTLWIPNH